MSSLCKSYVISGSDKLLHMWKGNPGVRSLGSIQQ